MNQTGSRSCGSGWGSTKQTIRNTLQKAAQRKVRPAERQQKRKWLAPEGRPGHLPQATGRTWRAFPGLQHRGHHGAGRGVGAKFRSSTSLARASLTLDPSLRSAPPGALPPPEPLHGSCVRTGLAPRTWATTKALHLTAQFSKTLLPFHPFFISLSSLSALSPPL